MSASLRALWDGATNRCPACHQAPIFRSMTVINERCPHCGVQFQPYQGDFLGAMAICYTITASATLVGYLALSRWLPFQLTGQILVWGTFALAFYIGFYRNMKGLWVGILYLMTGLRDHL